MNQAEIAGAVSEVLGQKISYQPITIAQYRERLEKAGRPAFLTQHLCAVALDYQNGMFAGEDKVIAEVTGKAPMSVHEFVRQRQEAFKSKGAAV